MVGDFGNALLLLEKLNTCRYLVAREVLDGAEKFRVFWRTIWSSWDVRIPASCICSKGFPASTPGVAVYTDKQYAVCGPIFSRKDRIWRCS